MEARIVILPYKGADEVQAPDDILTLETSEDDLQSLVERHEDFPYGLSVYVGSRTNPIFQRLRTLLLTEYFFREDEHYSVWTDADEDDRSALERMQERYARLERAYEDMLEAHRVHASDLRNQYTQLMTHHREILEKYMALLREKVSARHHDFSSLDGAPPVGDEWI